MAASPDSTSLPSNHGPRERADRDARLNMRSLLELSERSAESDPARIFNAAILSIMGRLRVLRACVLLPEGDRLAAPASLCKGLTPFSIALLQDDEMQRVTHDLHDHDVLEERGMVLLVPLHSRQGLMGVLCLGPSIDAAKYDDPDVWAYLDLARRIIATAVHNATLVQSLMEANTSLELRTLMVTTLFETARDFASARRREDLLRILALRLMGQLMVSTYALYLKEPLDGKTIIASRDNVPELHQIYDDVIAIQSPAIVSTLPLNSPLRTRCEQTGIALLAPMTIHGDVRGVLAVQGKLTGQPFTPEELAFVEALGSTAITAIDHARLLEEERAKQRMEDELEIAAAIQRGLFPRVMNPIGGLEIAARTQPSRVVGGDYYDVIRLDDHRVLLAIADVAGKGVPAALLMANVQAALNVLATADVSLPVLLHRLNTLVCSNTEPEVFVTMFVGIVDTQQRKLTYVNAGHHPPLLVHGGSAVALREGGVLVGVITDPPDYQVGSVAMQPNDLLVLYTDGVVEAHDGAAQYGVPAVEQLVLSLQQSTAAEIVEAIHHEVNRFRHQDAPDDDTSVVIVRML